MDFFYGYQETKLKPYLKMAVQRLQIANNKKHAVVKHQKREIAKLLEDGKEEKARIKVEHVIREDFTMECYELIELLCDLMHERVRYLSSQKECPVDLLESVSTLIWCSTQVDISELQEVRNQLTKKFGKKFAEDALANKGGVVNERLLAKLSVQPPSAFLVVSYLQEIAKEYNVEWTPTDIGVTNLDAAVATPVGFSVPMAPGSEFRSVYQRNSTLEAGVPPPYSDETVVATLAPETASSTATATTSDASIQKDPTGAPPSASNTSSDGFASRDNAINFSLPQATSVSSAPADESGSMSHTDIPSAPTTAPIRPNTNNGGGDADTPPPAPGGGGNSYDDLAARFAKLKNT